ncbi:hypothetical protein VRU48_19150 [Pedobacter sp. KR3-3]|uniref:Uncharacterized protein n=1 Tax=Pedobacter albus TaxID=3113905 RepID=A0ABU7ICQ2_9SPHI|nr:hypothetical protein [Pedobacter sp. KR3-3]MEE1947252.1 hypothetical protein [Pedobacter sp. KR3-3]
MGKDQWKYELHIGFSDEPLYREGVRMYFDNLRDALRKLSLIPDYVYKTALSAGPYLARKIDRVQLVSIGEQRLMLEAKLVIPDSDQPAILPGIYYHFPEGTSDIGKESGIDFSTFRGYDAENRSLLTSYLVTENTETFKAILAIRDLREEASERFSQEKCCCRSTVLQLFGNGENRSRDILQHPYIEEFYYRDCNDAVRDLLALNYDYLNEYLAWEQDLPDFYSRAGIRLNGSDIIELLAVREGKKRMAFDEPLPPGAYLNVRGNPENYGLTLPFSLLESMTKMTTVYRTGTYNREQFTMEKVPELDNIIAVQPIPAKAPVKRNVPKIKRSKGKGL